MIENVLATKLVLSFVPPLGRRLETHHSTTTGKVAGLINRYNYNRGVRLWLRITHICRLQSDISSCFPGEGYLSGEGKESRRRAGRAAPFVHGGEVDISRHLTSISKDL